MATGCSLHPALRDQEANLKNTKSTLSPSTRGRDVAKELTAKKNITKESTIVFLRDQVYRESQLKIGWTEQKCIEMDKLAQEDHTYRLSKEEFKRVQGQWYLSHIEQIGQEFADAPSIRLSSCSNKQEPSPSRMRRRTCRTHSFSTISENGTLLPQVLHGGTGTRPKAGGAHEFNSFLKCLLQ